MSDQTLTLTKRYSFQLCQLQKPQHQHRTRQPSHPLFSVTFTVNYEVEYLPFYYHMNLKSDKKPPFSLPRCLLLDQDKVKNTMFALLSQALIPEPEMESIIKIVSVKAKSVASDPCNDGFDVIPIIMSLRVVWVQEYNLDVQLAWERLLPGGAVISLNLPATEKSVRELDRMVFEGEGCFWPCKAGEEKDFMCAICLKEFEGGEEIRRMPCLHVYHGDCIVRWLKNSHLCPSCRFPMPVCKVVDGTFSFLRRKHCVRPVAVGGKIRKGARMSVRQVY
ncbi:hypothetical protein JCGZ_12158 [Jatropha curcas]|uniref:RING-type E3 ubiquitin transferase n=1 Tax=Jatropha curcas TaxID=180498 RepID=A0A067K9F7_JATCU|nr:RING-H2 finger protein ATL80-like [Jatropha curcas]KDP32866.1 hypothetical protein JCGZ_12158 [Jatropha curcas]